MTSSEYKNRIAQLESRCLELEELIEKQAAELKKRKFEDKNTFMIKLTTGWYTRIEDIMHDADNLNITFLSNSFCVVTVIIDSWGTEFTANDGNMDKHGHIQAEYTVGRILNEIESSNYTHKFFISDRYIHGFISVTGNEAAFFTELESNLTYAKSVLKEQYSIETRYGVSQIHEGLLSIKTCYDESLRVFEYMTMLDMNCPVLTYFEASHGTSGKKGPDIGIDFTRRIINCFEIGDYSGVESLIRSVIRDEFEHSPPSIEIARIRFYGIINVILNLMHEFGETIDVEQIISRNSIDALFQSSTVTELRSAAEALLGTIVEALNRQNNRNLPQWVLKMADSIREHYSDPNLNATVLAAEFGLNSTYASRVFKQIMGKGIFEFIHQMRIEAAVILLQEGVPVKDTAHAVGYIDSSTMNRAFKKYLGTNPSYYTK